MNMHVMHCNSVQSKLISHEILVSEILPLMKLQLDDPEPKYFYYATHQETLGPLLDVLGFDMFERSEPAGSLFIELFKSNLTNKDYVSLDYVHGLTNNVKIGKTIYLSTFEKMINKIFSEPNTLSEAVFNTSTENICSKLDFLKFVEMSNTQFQAPILSDAHEFLKKMTAAHGTGKILEEFVIYKSLKDEL